MKKQSLENICKTSIMLWSVCHTAFRFLGKQWFDDDRREQTICQLELFIEQLLRDDLSAAVLVPRKQKQGQYANLVKSCAQTADQATLESIRRVSDASLSDLVSRGENIKAVKDLATCAIAVSVALANGLNKVLLEATLHKQGLLPTHEELDDEINALLLSMAECAAADTAMVV